MFVKGYAFDDEKILQIIGAKDVKDEKYLRFVAKLMWYVYDFAGREHMVLAAEQMKRLGYVPVIRVKEEHCSEDKEKLEGIDVGMPSYVKAVKKYLTDPTILYLLDG